MVTNVDTLGLSVYLPSDLLAPDAHRRRAAALIETIAELPEFIVRHWGATQVPEPERLVEIVLGIPHAINFTGDPPAFITSLRRHLRQSEISKPSSDATIALVSRLTRLQHPGD